MIRPTLILSCLWSASLLICQDMVAHVAANLKLERDPEKPFLIWKACGQIAAGDELFWLGPQLQTEM